MRAVRRRPGTRADSPIPLTKCGVSARHSGISGVEWGGALDARPGTQLMTPPFQAVVNMLKMQNCSDLGLAGFRFPVYVDSVKTTIDIPDAALADAMRFTGAKTKREAVVKALEGFNRQQRVRDLVASFGTLDFASNDEIEAGDLEEIAVKEAGGRKA